MEIMLQELLTRIARSDSTEIDAILQAISRRYAVQHPDWEIAFLSLPKDNHTERIRILESILELEQRRTDCHTSVRAGSQ